MNTNKIIELASAIESKTWKGKKTGLFAGAGIVISNVQPTDTQDLTVVVSNYASEISSLLFELKDLFAGQLNSNNKYAFYDRFAASANAYIGENGDGYEALGAIASEAVKIAAERYGTYYFAYGSNMDIDQFLRRCPEARFFQTTKLYGYQFNLDSKGAATMHKNCDSFVQGVVWLITENDEETLDRYEGVRSECYEKKHINIPIKGGTVSALTYLSLRGAFDCKSRAGYMDKIIKAAEDLGFDESYLAMLKKFPR